LRILILGGTRFLGPRIVQSLVAAGDSVTLLHRNARVGREGGVESVRGDRGEPTGLAALNGRRFDALLDLSGQYESDWIETALQTFAGRIDRYVFISSGAVYRPSPQVPWPEATPYGPDPFWGRLAVEKIRSEKLLWEAHRAGVCRVTSLRLPYVLGPANFVDRESFVFNRILQSRPILLPGGGNALSQFVYVDDAAAAIVGAIQQPDTAAGQAYNVVYADAITNRGWVELCSSVLGVEARVVPIDTDALGVGSPTFDLSDVVFPFPDRHYMLDGTKLTREIGIAPGTGIEQMIEHYAEWWFAADAKPPIRSYQREERALLALGLKTDT
jgi:nucleoside-diphosphate-sugar epimerase